jgi:hypothetical protein
MQNGHYCCPFLAKITMYFQILVKLSNIIFNENPFRRPGFMPVDTQQYKQMD